MQTLIMHAIPAAFLLQINCVRVWHGQSSQGMYIYTYFKTRFLSVVLAHDVNILQFSDVATPGTYAILS